MDNERKKKLLESMKKFNKDQKDSILDFGDSSENIEVIPTGIDVLDNFIGGGTKQGSFSIVYGGYSAGKSTLVLQQIANAQKQGKICCYIDLEHSFDKERATQLGIDLNELILAERCKNAEQALEIIRALCKEKVVDYIAIDSIQAMSPINEQENKGKERQLAEKEIAELARTLSKFFRVVSPDVFNAKVSVVMIGQIRIHGIGTFFTRAGLTGGEALKHWGNQILFVRHGQRSDAPVSKYKRYFYDKDDKLRYKTESTEIGFDAVFKLEKTKSSKSQSEGSEIHVPFVYEKGFVSQIEETDDMPIRISGEGMTPEKCEEVKKELIEKGIMPKRTDLEKEIDEELINKGKDAVNDFDESKSIKVEGKKRKRGRPKKHSKVLDMVEDELNAIGDKE